MSLIRAVRPVMSSISGVVASTSPYFSWGDDFEGGNLDKQTDIDLTPTIVTDPDDAGNKCLYCNVHAEQVDKIFSNYFADHNLEFSFRIRAQSIEDNRSAAVYLMDYDGGNY